jgi:chromosome segregation ATPase
MIRCQCGKVYEINVTVKGLEQARHEDGVPVTQEDLQALRERVAELSLSLSHTLVERDSLKAKNKELDGMVGRAVEDRREAEKMAEQASTRIEQFRRENERLRGVVEDMRKLLGGLDV